MSRRALIHLTIAVTVAVTIAVFASMAATGEPPDEVTTADAPAPADKPRNDVVWAAVRQEAAEVDARAGRWYAAAAAVDAWNAQVAWDTELARQAQEAADAAAAAAEAAEAAERPSRPSTARPAAGPGPVTSGGNVNGYPCGGDLPPCWVLSRESGGNPLAENPTSSASGLWQFIDSTWAGYGGYSHASHAPVSVQNERARQVWAGGAGCSAWSAC